ncbi:7-cyano-7-deazaguanine synthase [candidate division WOR-1 bacterium DG_54_3]|uniref:7-cyano-7-deazaguanine synthase n=1 Tax=candidate division WOR-1 bacterium DG_54_3 TaxID=1703775 RepID=A0A0S7Y5F4_UNCSA|nr:MAG: 7-cyano-7-deazaguanine synthase [candidate division WOR-1 bacterium DG_54_3]
MKSTESVVLFSCGIDSTTALYWAIKQYNKVYSLTFDYGQRQKLEISMARQLASRLKVPQTVLRIDLSQIGGSSLTDKNLPLPQYDRLEEIEEGPPSTYVPFRNGIFLSLATAWAEVKGIREIVCGFNVIDSPNYPDTQEEFVKAMEKAINQGTRAYFTHEQIKIITPFTSLKKSEIIKEGLALGADYSYSLSCYSGTEIPCQKCSSCLLRQKAWEELGMKDHLVLRLEKEGKI